MKKSKLSWVQNSNRWKIDPQYHKFWDTLLGSILNGLGEDLGAILGAKMGPKSKKNGIKNKSDFMTKLYGRRSRKEGVTWTGPAPLAAPHIRARSVPKNKESTNQGKKGPKDERMNGWRDEWMKGWRDAKWMKGWMDEEMKGWRDDKRDLTRHGPKARRI